MMCKTLLFVNILVSTLNIFKSYRVKPMIPVTKETEPLLELDRDEHKFDVFLSFHRASLLVSDLKIFLPFTINLDPYIKKIAKNQYQHLVDEEAMFFTQTRLNWNPTYFNSDKDRGSKRKRSPVNSFVPIRSHMEAYPVSVFSVSSFLIN